MLLPPLRLRYKCTTSLNNAELFQWRTWWSQWFTDSTQICGIRKVTRCVTDQFSTAWACLPLCTSMTTSHCGRGVCCHHRRTCGERTYGRTQICGSSATNTHTQPTLTYSGLLACWVCRRGCWLGGRWERSLSRPCPSTRSANQGSTMLGALIPA